MIYKPIYLPTPLTLFDPLLNKILPPVKTYILHCQYLLTMNIGKIRKAISGTRMLESILFVVIGIYAVAVAVPNALNTISGASISNSTLAPLVTTLTPLVAVFAIVLGFVYLLTHTKSEF